jgi:hypothetical protein
MVADVGLYCFAGAAVRFSCVLLFAVKPAGCLVNDQPGDGITLLRLGRFLKRFSGCIVAEAAQHPTAPIAARIYETITMPISAYLQVCVLPKDRAPSVRRIV